MPQAKPSPKPEEISIGRWVFRGLLVLLLLLALWFSWYVHNDRYVITADVIELDAPEVCWPASAGGVISAPYRAHRSRAPKRAFLDYCGVVRTTHGDFLLPPTKPRPWVGQKRADVHRRLKPGCRVDLVVLSAHGRPQETRRPSRRKPLPWIRRVMFTYPC